MQKIVSLAFLLIVPVSMASAEDLALKIDVSNGVWFRCEFAHSQIPPDDECRMLDDDGFQLINGIVHHVKVTNSPETKCRHNRAGNCFLQSQQDLEAERSEIGPIELSKSYAEVTWLGCTQKYDISRHAHFLELKPNEEQCWWTPDKRYFVARYPSPIKIISED